MNARPVILRSCLALALASCGATQQTVAAREPLPAAPAPGPDPADAAAMSSVPAPAPDPLVADAAAPAVALADAAAAAAPVDTAPADAAAAASTDAAAPAARADAAAAPRPREPRPQGNAARPNDAGAAAAAPAGGNAEVLARGRSAFQRTCNRCHPNGGADIGPRLTGINWTEARMRTQIRQGEGTMRPIPPSRLPDAELADLIAYLRTIRAVR